MPETKGRTDSSLYGGGRACTLAWVAFVLKHYVQYRPGRHPDDGNVIVLHVHSPHTAWPLQVAEQGSELARAGLGPLMFVLAHTVARTHATRPR